MEKIVTVLKGGHGMLFGIDGRNVTLSNETTLQDAEHIAKFYPGNYVQIDEIPEPEPTSTVTDSKTTKPGK